MIEEYSFGRIVVSGQTYTSDIKIINQSVIPNWWRKEGHVFVLADLEDLFLSQPEHIVLGLGHSGYVAIDQGVISKAKKLGIILHKYKTTQAVEIYNDLLSQNGSVAAGLHLTC